MIFALTAKKSPLFMAINSFIKTMLEVYSDYSILHNTVIILSSYIFNKLGLLILYLFISLADAQAFEIHCRM